MQKTSKHISVEQEISYAIERLKQWGLDIDSMEQMRKESFLFQLENIAKAGYNQAMEQMSSVEFNFDKSEIKKLHSI
jgi:glycyl-tRNA synthetase alpha subunit